MSRRAKYSCLLFWAVLVLHCTRKPTNIEKAFVEQVIGEFTQDRALYYLHGGSPKPNSEIMEKTLSRHSLKLFDFKPPLRRFFPEIYTRLLGG